MRYSLSMTNRGGYEIRKEFKRVDQAKTFAAFYPLKSFFSWIYDKQKDEMIWQNDYKDKWFRCNNDNFIPYHC